MELYGNAAAGRTFSSACLHVTVRTVFMHLLEKQVGIAVQKLLIMMIIITSIMQRTVLQAVWTP